MKRLIPSLALVAATWFANPALAGDFAVIVNKANATAVDKATIQKIYTGDTKKWADGTSVSAVDLPDDDAVRAAFSTGVLGKTVANVKALWSQLIFSGTAVPPEGPGLG
jgi:ABC-type phosphate transport system substrate-binding protein